MATSWFKFTGTSGSNLIDPLNYTQIFSAPAFITGSITVAFIFATTQIINRTVRPVIPGSFSPTGSVTVAEILADVITATSSPNCYVS